jgi:hypothetical protein
VIGWFGLLLLIDHSARATITFLAVHTAGSFIQLFLVGQGHGAADLVVVTAIVLGSQIPVLTTAMALRGIAGRAAASMAEQERIRTERAVAEQLHADRNARYAQLSTTVIPLLADLTAGAVDVTDRRVRAEYAVAAARLRRLFAEHDEVADPLLYELRACLDLAERNGITVYLGTCGERPTPPLPVRRALTEPALATMAAAASSARVTVLGSPEEVTVSVLADADESAGSTELVGTSEESVTVTRMVMQGKLWMEATWRAN